MTEETKDIYKLIGNYEATTKTIFSRLEKIDRDNGKILDSMKDVELLCSKMEGDIEVNSESIMDLEKHGVPKRTRQKIDTGLVLGIVNTLIQFIKTAMGWP